MEPEQQSTDGGGPSQLRRGVPRSRTQSGRVLAALLIAAILAAGCTSDGGDGVELQADETTSTDRADRTDGTDESVSGETGGSGDGENQPVAGDEEQSAGTGDPDADPQPDGSSTTTAPGSTGGSDSGGDQGSGGTSGVGAILNETGEGLTGAELEDYLANRYKAFWQAFDAARNGPSAQPDLDYPELANLASGELLDTSLAQLEELDASGQAIRDPDQPAVPGLDPTSVHRIRFVQLDGGVAELETCLVNDQVRYVVDGGQVVSDSVITVEGRSTMAKTDGTWKIIRSEAVAIDQGVTGCWLDGQYSH